MTQSKQTLRLKALLQDIEAGDPTIPGRSADDLKFSVPMEGLVKEGSIQRVVLPGLALGDIYNLTFARSQEVLVDTDCDLVDITLRRRGGYVSSVAEEARQYLEGSELEINGLRAGVANLADLKADSEIQMLVLHLRPEVLTRTLGIKTHQLPAALGQFLNGTSRQDHIELRYTLPDRLAMALDCIMDTDIDPNLRERYFQSKLTECLLDVLDLLQRPDKLAQRDGLVGKHLRPFDKARSILLREFRQPPQLDELAKRVGVSRRKLTQGFRNQYGTSPMGFAQKLRLEEARRLLRTGEFQIAQVAHRVGYQQAANFSQAYKAHFGHTPRNDL